MILLYHHIAPPYLASTKYCVGDGWEFTVSPEGFERHLALFAGRGYRFALLSEIVKSIVETGKEPKRTVAITFDDGWQDNYEFALPILKRFGIPASFFITTAHLKDQAANGKRMSRRQLKNLLKEGMEIGSHTINHPDLTKISKEEARSEICDSKSGIENLLGCSVDLFAYPGGAFNKNIAQIVKEAGYTAACSVLSPADNDRSSLFWLYRSTLNESLQGLGDYYRLSPMLTGLLEFRVRRRLLHALGS